MRTEQLDSQVTAAKVESFSSLAQELFQADNFRSNSDLKSQTSTGVLKDFGNLEIVSEASSKSDVGSCEWQAEQGLPCQEPESKDGFKKTAADENSSIDGSTGPTFPETDFDTLTKAAAKSDVGSCEWQAEQGLPCQEPESKDGFKKTAADENSSIDGSTGPTFPEPDFDSLTKAVAKSDVGSCEWQAEQGLPCQEPEKKSASKEIDG
ncbi:MAG: hypothetical protein HY986_25645 [Candidatus Melainabacteria bacterium]|nr:hypothetical protein [Candidatus Melainabacteria bacterium]